MEREAARQLARVQIAMWLPASCAVCHRPYLDVDDFLERNPRAGGGAGQPWDGTFVDDACYRAHVEGES